jgi:hypothetical protein
MVGKMELDKRWNSPFSQSAIFRSDIWKSTNELCRQERSLFFLFLLSSSFSFFLRMWRHCHGAALD